MTLQHHGEQVLSSGKAVRGAEEAHRTVAQNKRMMIILSIGGPLLLFVLFNNRGVLQRMKLENQKKELVVRVLELQREQSELDHFSKLLDSDPAAIEKVARERYGMVREGETVDRVQRTK